ncbi:MAG TPA: hypothetical protein VMX17_01015 [Candidatus Glassbacteria bacterium]|nr:hypothetical protein [Candidatus Glassbacteria bacterium]
MSKEKTLAQWTKEVEDLLMKDYGITTGDCTDDTQLAVEFKDGTSPQEFVDFIGDKMHLDKLNRDFYA